MSSQLYPADFYARRREHTSVAARRILDALTADVAIDRVADIGCGTGTFLAAALDRGASFAFGVEGAWVDRSMLDDQRIVFENQDLGRSLSGPTVDLCLCLEVAEHLPPERAAGLVGEIAALAPAVLFGAAIPGQGGVGHLNEQWQSYWAELFESQGYAAYDVIRPAIWTDETVPAWYRQNTILYLRSEHAVSGLVPTAPALLDRVHPAFWARANRELAYADALPESEVLRRRAEAAHGQ